MSNGNVRRIRVLLVSPCFGSYGGVEAFVLAVADTLLRNPLYDVRICFKRTATFSLDAGLAEACRPYPVEFCDRGSRALLSAIAWADVVHGQNASPDVAGLTLLLGKPLAFTIHDFLAPTPHWRRLAWRLSARAAARRWFNSQSVWSTWERQPLPGSERVPTVSRFVSSFVEPPRRRGFVFVGRLVDSKGVDILLRAYRNAAVDADVWPLTIVGDGPLRPQLEEICARERIRGVTFTGFVDEGTKASAIGKAKWLVAPSYAHEGLGLVAFEARHTGVPCIVARHGGLPEAAGRDALVCEPGDAASLAVALRAAAAMPEADYVARCQRTRFDLAGELPPQSFYADAYRGLAGVRGV
jgi:glycosyltransferase involved in cell wall biosynthesis